MLFYLFALMAVGLSVHLYRIQILRGPMLAAQARDQRLETIDLVARRGTIFDRDGNTLVRSLPSQSVYVTPREVLDKSATARALATALGVPANSMLERLRSTQPYVLLDRKIDHDASERVLKLKLAGVSIVPEETGVRFVPTGRLASTVLGFTGIDENGLDGIEYSFDRILRGKPGRMTLEADQWGRAIPFSAPHVTEAAKPGYSLTLTLDSYLQYNVERTLRDAVKRWHARSGSSIVMDPWSGEIVALRCGREKPITLGAISCHTTGNSIFSGTPLSGNPPLAVKFSTNLNVTTGSYRVDFGDGASQWLSATTTSHTYSTAGTYVASLVQSIGNCYGLTGDALSICQIGNNRTLATLTVSATSTGTTSGTNINTAHDFYAFLYSCVDPELRAAAGLPWPVPPVADLPSVPDEAVDVRLDVSAVLEAKLAALRAHATQVSVWDGPPAAFALSNGLAQPVVATESFRLLAGPPGRRPPRHRREPERRQQRAGHRRRWSGWRHQRLGDQHRFDRG